MRRYPLRQQSRRCQPAVVANDWIEQTLKPQLADVATRDWTAEPLGKFMVALHDQISARFRAGALSEAEVAEARSLVRAATEAIPGVIVVRHDIPARSAGVLRAVRRKDDN